jgi:hypothetical protein
MALLGLVHEDVEAHFVDPEAHVAFAGQITLTQCPAFILPAGFEARDRPPQTDLWLLVPTTLLAPLAWRL